MGTRVIAIAALLALLACKKSDPAKADLQKLADKLNKKLEALRGIDQSMVEMGELAARTSATSGGSGAAPVTQQLFEQSMQLVRFCKDLPQTLAFLRTNPKDYASADVRKRMEDLNDAVNRVEMNQRGCRQPGPDLDCLRWCMEWYDSVIGELYLLHLDAQLQHVDLTLVRNRYPDDGSAATGAR